MKYTSGLLLYLLSQSVHAMISDDGVEYEPLSFETSLQVKLIEHFPGQQITLPEIRVKKVLCDSVGMGYLNCNTKITYNNKEYNFYNLGVEGVTTSQTHPF